MMCINTHTTCISFSTSIHLIHPTQGDISIRGGIFRKAPTLFNIFLEVQTNWFVDPLLPWLCRFYPHTTKFFSPPTTPPRLEQHCQPLPITNPLYFVSLICQTCKTSLISLKNSHKACQQLLHKVKNGCHLLKLCIPCTLR
jgi:hypothetical protein